MWLLIPSCYQWNQTPEIPWKLFHMLQVSFLNFDVIVCIIGGVCVCPQSMQEALTFFELDSVLSLRERVILLHHRVSYRYSFGRYNRISLSSVCICVHTLHLRLKIAFNQSILVALMAFKPFQSNSMFNLFVYYCNLCCHRYTDRDRSTYQANVPPRHRRIIKELRYFLHSPHVDIRVYPSEHEWVTMNYTLQSNLW